jgi:hypothetical protein
MQAQARDLRIIPMAPALRLVLPMLAVAAVVAYALFRQPAAPTTGARAVLNEQLRAYATWEREHPHECIVPLPGPTSIGNAHYERHAVWFLEDQGAGVLLRYRDWFRATYAAEHPAGDRHDRYLIECAPAAVLGDPEWIARYLAAAPHAP